MVEEVKVREGYKRTEVGIIPEDWEVVPIGEIFDFKNGLNKEKKYFGEGTPIVNYMDVYKNRAITRNHIKGKVKVSKDEIKSYNVQKGDVFFTRTSETVNEIGLTSVILDHINNLVFSGFILRARPKRFNLSDEFKKYCFSSVFVRKEIISNATYTTRALTNGRVLSKIEMPIPNISEQKAIATVLTDTDNLITSLEKLIDKKKKIKQGTMQQLLTGKKRLDGFSGEWEVKELLELFSFKQGVQCPVEQQSMEKTEKSVRFIRIIDVTSNNELPRYIESPGKEHHIYKDDLFMIRYGEPGVVGYGFEGVIANNLFRLIPRIKAYNKFNYYLLSYMKNDISQLSSSTTMAALNFKSLKLLNIRLTSDIKEQKAIAKILSDMDLEIELLEQKLSKYKTIKQGMMQELLTGRSRLI